MHQGIELSWDRVYMSWFLDVFKVQKRIGEQKKSENIKNKIKKWGREGRTLGAGPNPAPLQTFQVNFHHPLKHLIRFGIFGKSDVLQI
jgi:hypothetical protein